MLQRKKQRTALISYPASQSYVVETLRRSFANILTSWKVISTIKEGEEAGVERSAAVVDLQWCDYDELDWDIKGMERCLYSCYVIRKSLIRKNHLAHTCDMYLSKNPNSSLKQCVPKTFFFNLSFADELDELLQDDLYELSDALEVDDDTKRWWILKPSLADKGQGIRLFNSRQMLEDIFEDFDPVSSEEEEEEEGAEGTNLPEHNRGDNATRVDSSQMREWVIQEYLDNPLLLDPRGSLVPEPSPDLNYLPQPRKFHLRVYCVAVAGLQVFVHHPYLALFAKSPYQYLRPNNDGRMDDLSCYLTNTCLQDEEPLNPEVNREVLVATWQQMENQSFYTTSKQEQGNILPSGGTLTKSDIEAVENKVENAIAEVFKAAISSGSGFQTMPNCFEIFGLDFLVSDNFEVWLLEVNACPDFKQTGPQLQSVIQSLFDSTLQAAVVPFFTARDETYTEIARDTAKSKKPKAERQIGSLRKVLDIEVSKAW